MTMPGFWSWIRWAIKNQKHPIMAIEMQKHFLFLNRFSSKRAQNLYIAKACVATEPLRTNRNKGIKNKRVRIISKNSRYSSIAMSVLFTYVKKAWITTIEYSHWLCSVSLIYIKTIRNLFRIKYINVIFFKYILKQPGSYFRKFTVRMHKITEYSVILAYSEEVIILQREHPALALKYLLQQIH